MPADKTRSRSRRSSPSDRVSRRDNRLEWLSLCFSFLHSHRIPNEPYCKNMLSAGQWNVVGVRTLCAAYAYSTRFTVRTRRYNFGVSPTHSRKIARNRFGLSPVIPSHRKSSAHAALLPFRSNCRPACVGRHRSITRNFASGVAASSKRARKGKPSAFQSVSSGICKSRNSPAGILRNGNTPPGKPYRSLCIPNARRPSVSRRGPRSGADRDGRSFGSNLREG